MATLEQIREQFPQYGDVSDGDLLMALHKKYYSDVHPRAFLNSIDGAANAHATIKRDDLKEWWRTNVRKKMDGESTADMSKRLSGTMDGPVGDPGSIGTVAARAGLQGMTFGAGDEIVAAGQSAISGVPYEQALKAERDRIALGREQNPKTAFASELAGAVAAPVAALKAGGSMASNMMRSGAVAGAEGMVYGFNAGEGNFGNRMENAKDTAKWAAGLGALAPVAGRAASMVYDTASLRKAIALTKDQAPSLEDLRVIASRIYQQADNVKNLPRDQFRQTAADIATRAKRSGLDPDLTPQSAKALSRIDEAAQNVDPNMGFSELDILRRKAAVPAGNVQTKAESALGSKMIEQLDEFVQNADPKLAKEIGEARDMWSRLRRSEVIQNAYDKASRQASGFENGIRIQFRSILNNKKLARGFTDTERKAMEAVVNGTKFGNIMKKIGKMGVGLSQQSNFLGASIGSGAGAALGSAAGPGGAAIGGLLVPALGTLAQKASERSTVRAADAARAIVANGGIAQVPQISTAVPGLLEEAVRRGVRGVEAVK